MMTARRNRQYDTTDRLQVVVGSRFFAFCCISLLGALAYVTLARRLPVGPGSTSSASPGDQANVASGDPPAAGPLLAAPLSLATPSSRLSDYTFTQIHMAMPVRITVWANSEREARDAGRAAFQRISGLLPCLSNYEPESELNRLVQIGAADLPHRVLVSPDLLAVLSYAQEVFQLTDGALDPSAGPLIELWKQARQEKLLPSQSEIDDALDRVGLDQIEIDREAGAVRVLRAGIQLDLGAIAKGYIADSALQVLRKRGIDSACIEAGGDFVVSQSPPGNSGWRIEIPGLGAMRLENCGISVSGDTVQFAEIDSIRYSHVVDPRTGTPLTNRIMAVVIAPRAIQSDALATAACLLEESDFEPIVEGIEGVRYWRWTVSAKDSPILP